MIDPQWFIAQLDSDKQGHLPLLLEAFNFNNNGDAKWRHGLKVVSLEVLQADGTHHRAVPTDIPWYFSMFSNQ
jgi:hypothetical protein